MMDNVTLVLVTTKRFAMDLMERYIDGDPDIIDFRRGNVILDTSIVGHLNQPALPKTENKKKQSPKEIEPDPGYSRESLFNALVKYFNEDELRTLLFKLDVDFQNIDGNTKEAKVRELILYFERTTSIPVLVDAIKEVRPNLGF